MGCLKPLLTSFGLVALALAGWLQVFFLQLDLTGYKEPWQTYSIESFDWDGKRPLKILFMTWGSRGDHQPNIALGLELARRGHDVTVMGMDRYRNLIERHPSLHYKEIIDSNIWKLAETFGSSEGADFIPLTKDYVIQSSREMIPQYLKAGKDVDVLFGSHSAMLELQHLTVAQKLRKPLFFLTHDMTLPTAQYSFDAAASRVQDYGRITNIINQRIFGIIFGLALTFGPSSEVRAIRQALGLTTPWPFMQLLSPEHLADFPILETRDPTLWPIPQDQPPHWYNTGYFVTHDEGREFPEELQSDLDSWIQERQALGRKLIYFAQGSFNHHAREIFTEILLDTLAELDMDGLALASTVDEKTIATTSLPAGDASLKIVKELDQNTVFPKCQVIVHHGGAGSASQAIRSGRPGVCLPSMPFQQVWGAKIADYGAGVLLLPDAMMEAFSLQHNNKLKNQTTNLLTAAIRQALQPAVQAKAQQLGALARDASEARGVSLGASMVEKHLQAWVNGVTPTSSADSPQEEL